MNTIVLSSGGLKGYSQLGALLYLSEIYDLNNFKNFIGSSVGALLSTLLVIGYNIDELIEKSFILNIETLINIDIFKIFINFGLNDGDDIKNLLICLFRNKNIDENITFKELYNLTDKNLIITSTSILEKKCKYFSYEYTPNISVLLALRMSVNIPFLFKPIKFNNDYYIDGGVTNIYPINKSNDLKNTIGIFTIDKYDYIIPKNFFEYISSIYSIFSKLIINNNIINNSLTIIIKNKSINIFEYNKKHNNIKKQLFDNGYNICKNYFKKNN